MIAFSLTLVSIINYHLNEEIRPTIVRELGVIIGKSLQDVLEQCDLEPIKVSFNPLDRVVYIPCKTEINTDYRFGAMLFSKKNHFFAYQLTELVAANTNDLDSELKNQYTLGEKKQEINHGHVL